MLEALSQFLLSLDAATQALLVGVIVTLVMGASRLIWPKAFADEEWQAKFKRTATAAVVALVAATVAASVEGWEEYTLASFIIAWLAAWAGSQLAHTGAKRIRGA